MGVIAWKMVVKTAEMELCGGIRHLTTSGGEKVAIRPDRR